MAVLDQVLPASSNILANFGRKAADVMDSIIVARSRRAEFDYYNSLTDAELAAKGLTRDDIPMHIFRDIMY